MKAELEKKLLEAAETDHLPKNLLNEIFEEYSEKIALAVNPVDCFSAPFIIAALESYKKAVIQQYSGVENAAKDLMEHLNIGRAIVPMKRGGLQ